MDANFRQNPLTGHWVLIAADRSERPNDFGSESFHRIRDRCPFCVGHETDTPDTIVAYDGHGDVVEDGHWLARVFPNKYPALFNHGGPVGFRREEPPTRQPYLAAQGEGVHELIVESPRHVESFGQLEPDERRLAIRVYQDRLRRLRDRDGVAYAMLFKNCRPAAGATIEHAHCQVIGTPIVPTAIHLQVERGRAYAESHGTSLGEDIVTFEQRDPVRVVEQTEHFVAFCPYASHLPYELWIYPIDSGLPFWGRDNWWRDDLADLLFRCVRRMENLLDAPAYNFGFHIAPFDTSAEPHYQWHVEIAPRLTKLAGFEWGTGCMINPVAPETAALRLREAGAT